MSKTLGPNLKIPVRWPTALRDAQNDGRQLRSSFEITDGTKVFGSGTVRRGTFNDVSALLDSLPHRDFELCDPSAGDRVRFTSAASALAFLSRQQQHRHLYMGLGGASAHFGFCICVNRNHERSEGAYGDDPSVVVRSRTHSYYAHFVSLSPRNLDVIRVLKRSYSTGPVRITSQLPLPYGGYSLDSPNAGALLCRGAHTSDCATRFLSLLMTMW